ncbi:MAG: 6-bladed beta-propeller [Tannerella sp.]|jgi:hypothetical protein|nr:6-bladed beta-propeller [Tannerella sp.]
MRKVLFTGVLFLICEVGFVFAQDLQKSRKVADVVTAGNDKVMVCKWSLLKDTVTLPLSFFTEELEVIKLDDREEALISTQSSVTIGEKYILTGGAQAHNVCFKLFDKTGKYLTDIGAFGQGPGEYGTIADATLDEKNERIYILSWSTRNILEYDLEGNFIRPINMPGNITKGKIYADPSGELVSVVAVPIIGNKYIAWTQKKTGEIVNAVEPGNLSINPREPNGAYSAFNHEISSSKNLEGVFDAYVFCFHTRKDTLYHYEPISGRLLPQFTVDFPGNTPPSHAYFEFPHHYAGWTGEEIRVSENSSYIGNHKFFIVDKSSLKGTFFKIRNDFWGDSEIGWPTYAFSNGYYTKNYEPAELMDELDKLLSNSKLSAEAKAKLTKLKSSVSEKDNNYIFYAKMK